MKKFLIIVFTVILVFSCAIFASAAYVDTSVETSLNSKYYELTTADEITTSWVYSSAYSFLNVSPSDAYANGFWSGCRLVFSSNANQLKAGDTHRVSGNFTIYCTDADSTLIYPLGVDEIYFTLTDSLGNSSRHTLPSASYSLSSTGVLRIDYRFTPSLDYNIDPNFYISFSSPIHFSNVGTTGSGTVSLTCTRCSFKWEKLTLSTSAYIAQAAGEITEAINASAGGAEVDLSSVEAALATIQNYMTGATDSLLSADSEQLTVLYYLLLNNIIPEIVDGFASCVDAVELGFSENVLAIQSQTTALSNILTAGFLNVTRTISTESDDVQAVINARFDEIIAFLEVALASSVTPDYGQVVTNAGSDLYDWNSFEGGFITNFDHAFSDIDFDEMSLSPGVVSAFAWLSSLWATFFLGFGDAASYIIFPLCFAVALAVVGRISSVVPSAGRIDKHKGG